MKVYLVSWYCVALGFHNTTNMCYLVFGCPLGWKPQVGIVVLQMLRGWFWHLEAMTNLEKWWLVFWLVGWCCGALEQLGLSCGGRLAAHIVGGRPRPWGGQGGFGRGEGPRGWIIEKSGRIYSPTNPFDYTCNPLFATLAVGGQRLGWVLACTWWTNDHKWWRAAAALVQHIPGYYWCRSTRPRHHYGHHKTQMQLLGKSFFTQMKSLTMEKDQHELTARLEIDKKLQTYHSFLASLTWYVGQKCRLFFLVFHWHLCVFRCVLICHLYLSYCIIVKLKCASSCVSSVGLS